MSTHLSARILSDMVSSKWIELYSCLKSFTISCQVSGPCVGSPQPNVKATEWGGPWGQAGELHHRDTLETERASQHRLRTSYLWPGLKTVTTLDTKNDCQDQAQSQISDWAWDLGMCLVVGFLMVYLLHTPTPWPWENWEKPFMLSFLIIQNQNSDLIFNDCVVCVMLTVVK